MESPRPLLLRFPGPSSPLLRFEQTPPQNREGLYRLWQELAPLVRRADPARYVAVEQALKEDLPFSVLVLYVFRECRRALEPTRSHRRAAE
ncbi:hypothetical protein DV704_08635 [Meiothermus sp. QL-1]|uniref:hypothetical protein n=1 Tax=Meiothermus sp. QL-1 TaxID=2058095 RepID=UPI000E0ADC09|nr:hypothetical protein [Meiothermus sp. QL-1]RDI95129.1 hypothetical protein DV704_08635 [Meiothermus sp. QL-1]